MADDNENSQEEKPKGGNKLILFIVLVIVIIALSIGGTLLAVKMLSPEPEPVAEVDEDGNPIASEEEQEEEKPKSPAIYFPLKPPLIVNYQARGRQRFLQAEISVMTRENDVIEAVEIHMPMIRNSLIMLFSGQVYEELQTDEGRELLKQQALVELQSIMQKELGKPGIEKVLFTNLVMQ